MNYEKMWYQLKASLITDKKGQVVNTMNALEVSEAASKFVPPAPAKEKKIGFTQ